MITLKNIAKSFNGRQVLKGISLTVQQNETLGIMGESGCGKTTLLNIMAGLTEFEGSIEKHGGTSYIFQQPRLLPNLTVRENLNFVGADMNDAENLLAEVGVEGGLYPEELSGGMASRVSLIRGFLFPGTLLMDEPFASLDVKRKNQLAELFVALKNKRPRAAVFVTHNLEEALRLCDRIILLEGGLIGNEFKAPFDECQIRKILIG